MRSRNIKPSFFNNEDLADVKIESRLLFIGLWCIADHRGILENRPKRIKIDIFPYDNIKVEPLLKELEKIGVIKFYKNSNYNLIKVINFEKHQSPHPKEKLKKDLLPDENGLSNTVSEKKSLTSKLQDSESNLQVTDKQRTCQADIMNPDIMNPDIMNPDIMNQAIKLLKKSNLPAIRSFTDKRKKHLKARINESKEFQTIEFWEKFVDIVNNSDFLSNRIENKGKHKNWKCDIDWVLNKDNFNKILEGKYSNTKNKEVSSIENQMKLLEEMGL